MYNPRVKKLAKLCIDSTEIVTNPDISAEMFLY